MSAIPQNWRDLAALLDPIGRCNDPLAQGRELDWYGIYALATSHLIAPTLHNELVKTDRLRMAPTDVQDALRELTLLNEARNDRQRAILRDTTRILNAEGIEPLIMKGGITLLPDQPPIFADRMMSDLDIALHNAPPERGAEALLAAGYWHATGQGPAAFRDSHHLAPLFHPNGEGYVEIHRDILFTARVPSGALSLTAACADAQPVNWGQLRLWIPSVEHRLLHNALHQQVQDEFKWTGRGCSLRQLWEFVQLRASPGAAGIDWNDHIERIDGFGVGDPVRVYLLLAEHLFAQPLPAGLHLERDIYRAENLKWFWLNHPRLLDCYYFSKRLKRLPARLLTPSWYPRKYRQLRRDGLKHL